MGGLRISVHGSRELQAVRARAKELPRELASQLNKQTRAQAEPMWKEAVAARVETALEARVLANTARVSVTRSNVTLKVAAIGRSLRGGAKPADIYAGVEFGANREQQRPTQYAKKRHTQRQFKPRNRKGYVVYPAAADVIPRIASLWVQTAVRTTHEALEGK